MQTVSWNERYKVVPEAPPSRWRTVQYTNGIVRREFLPFVIDDIHSPRPANHPGFRRLHGFPVLRKNQVWVEKGTGELWVIAAIRTKETGARAISLRPYGCGIVCRIRSEKALLRGYRVWEEALKYRARLA